MIKVVAPRIAQTIVDRAIQVHGGAGVCQDTPLPVFFAYARTIRIADGPDDVHLASIAKQELKRYFQSSL
jgi:alkylation response protein AidB-like acyl-CoA dehydrogenase